MNPLVSENGFLFHIYYVNWGEKQTMKHTFSDILNPQRQKGEMLIYISTAGVKGNFSTRSSFMPHVLS